MTTALGHERNDTIDAFRGIAIVSVLLYHYTGSPADPALWHTRLADVGRFGVQLFFVISGIVISMTVRSTRGRPLEFLLKRLARLYPAYVATMTITLIVLTVAGSTIFHHDLSSYLSTLIIFDGRQPFIDPSYWSLVPEIKFYAYVALSMYLFKDRYWAGLVLVTCAGFALSLFGGGALADGLLVAEYMPLFLTGVAAWLLIYEKRSVGWICAGTALATLPYAAMRFDVAFHPHWLMIAYIGLLGGALIGLLAARVRTGLGPLAWLGRRSYSLYLLHQALGVTALSALERSGIPVVLALIIVIAGAICLAALSFRIVEEPARRIVVRTYGRLRAGAARSTLAIPSAIRFEGH